MPNIFDIPDYGRDIMSDPEGFRESEKNVVEDLRVLPEPDASVVEERRRKALEVASNHTSASAPFEELLSRAVIIEKYLSTGAIDATPPEQADQYSA